MWIRVSAQYETDEFEIINVDAIEYFRKSIHTKNDTQIYSISFDFKSGKCRYWPFTSSVARDKEFERLFRILNNTETNS